MNLEITRLVRYEPRTGRLFWRERVPEDFNSSGYPKESLCSSWNKRWSGKEAFTSVGNHGYKTGSIFSKNYLAHRVAWYCMTGDWPNGFVDHINGCRTDNRWENLRDVSCAESSKNVAARENTTSGYTGVYLRDNGRFSARIKADGVFTFLGTYDTFEEAYEVRKQAERDLGFHENHGRRQ